MFKNYFQTAWRSFLRNKFYTVINIAGLGLGLASAVVIFSLIRYHLNFDNFHPASERLFRITSILNIDGKKYIPGVPSPMAEAFRSDYAFDEKTARVFTVSRQLVSTENRSSADKYEEEVGFADPSFFELMHFPLIRGDKNSLAKPGNAWITRRLAKKYFGNSDPLGKTIRVDNKLNFQVTAVMEDLPVNTDRRQEIYLPFTDLKKLQPWQDEGNWRNVNTNMQCFIRLRPGVNTEQVNRAFPAIVKKYFPKEDHKTWQFRLQPVNEIHTDTRYGASTSRDNLKGLATIGIFLVLAACINFINLATAQAIRRSKEVGVRKVLGGSRRELFWQFIFETSLICTIAMMTGLVIAEMAIPPINALFELKVSLILTDWDAPVFLAALLIMTIVASGLYPGLMLSKVEPVLALKGKTSSAGSGPAGLRKSLVIVQFAIAQLLIIGTVVISRQMKYAAEADLGFHKEGIILMRVPDMQKRDQLRAKLASIPGVTHISFNSGPPLQEGANQTEIRMADKADKENFLVTCRYVDTAYASIFGLKLLSGHHLAASDTVKEFLINSATVRALGFSDPAQALDKQIIINNDPGTIAGVIRDFHNKSLHSEVDPLVISTNKDWYFNCSVKVAQGFTDQSQSRIAEAWKQTFPDHVYNREILSERIGKLYQSDFNLLSLIELFTAIAVFIGAMGLYGLIAFITGEKRKEIAVRKVLGASVASIVYLFGRQFGALVLAAFLIAAPLGWWVMTMWLQNFAYRVPLGAGIFAITLAVTFGIMTLTAGYKSLRSAQALPAKSLRSE